MFCSRTVTSAIYRQIQLSQLDSSRTTFIEHYQYNYLQLSIPCMGKGKCSHSWPFSFHVNPFKVVSLFSILH